MVTIIMTTTLVSSFAVTTLDTADGCKEGGLDGRAAPSATGARRRPSGTPARRKGRPRYPARRIIGAVMRSDGPGFWLRSPVAVAAYAGAWTSFALGYAAIHLITNAPSLARAASSAFFVVTPAALLGLVVIWLCRFLPFPPKRPL